MSFLLILTGCDYFSEESIVQKKLKEIDVGKYKYLKEIYDQQWNEICVLVPYQGGVSPKDSINSEFYNKKIYETDIANDHNDAYWYLIYKKEDGFSYEKLARANYLDIEQRIFSDDIKNVFEGENFKPRGCVSFKSGAFFKFEVTHKENTRTYITLGEI